MHSLTKVNSQSVITHFLAVPIICKATSVKSILWLLGAESGGATNPQPPPLCPVKVPTLASCLNAAQPANTKRSHNNLGQVHKNSETQKMQHGMLH